MRAAEGSREVGNLSSVATALCNLSRVHLLTGRPNSAIDLARQGIEIYDRLGLTLRLANGRYALGVAFTHADRHPEALEEFGEALRIFAQNRQRLWEGATHFRIAEARLRSRRPALAAQHAEQALALGCIGGTRCGATSWCCSARRCAFSGRPTAHAPASGRHWLCTSTWARRRPTAYGPCWRPRRWPEAAGTPPRRTFSIRLCGCGIVLRRRSVASGARGPQAPTAKVSGP